MPVTKTELTYTTDSVRQFAKQLRKQKEQEANNRRQQRIKFATAHELKQKGK
jgi:hypothetical protein